LSTSGSAQLVETSGTQKQAILSAVDHPRGRVNSLRPQILRISWIKGRGMHETGYGLYRRNPACAQRSAVREQTGNGRTAAKLAQVTPVSPAAHAVSPAVSALRQATFLPGDLRANSAV
jgi:hypothetical protein